MKHFKEEFVELMMDESEGDISEAIATISILFEKWYKATEENWNDDPNWTGGYDTIEEMAQAAKQEVVSWVESAIDQIIAWPIK